jgi:hypothetical protein
LTGLAIETAQQLQQEMENAIRNKCLISPKDHGGSARPLRNGICSIWDGAADFTGVTLACPTAMAVGVII